jgi:hypothetical protein
MNAIVNDIPPQQVRSSRMKLIIIFAIFAFPVVGSTLWFYLGPSMASTVNYGRLLQPVVDVSASGTVKAARSDPRTKGRWLFIQRETTACADACASRLQLVRNMNVALNKYSNRIARVALIDGQTEAAKTMLTSLPDTILLAQAVNEDPVASVLNGGDGFLLIDPNNFAVLAYPLEFDGKRVMKDMNRLFKNSVPPAVK